MPDPGGVGLRLAPGQQYFIELLTIRDAGHPPILTPAAASENRQADIDASPTGASPRPFGPRGRREQLPGRDVTAALPPQDAAPNAVLKAGLPVAIS